MTLDSEKFATDGVPEKQTAAPILGSWQQSRLYAPKKTDGSRIQDPQFLVLVREPMTHVKRSEIWEAAR